MTVELQRTVEELTLATRILVNEGVIDGFGHVSARSAEHGDRYYMVCDNSVEAAVAGNFVELDSESNPVSSASGKPSIERFIHGEIYRARPDVGAIVHTHAPFLIPLGVSATPLQPLYHMCGFLARRVPVFDIARENGVTDMLVTNCQRGRSLARSLGKSALVLMRGHGATVVGSSIREAVFSAVYAPVNAQLQTAAIQLRSPKYLSSEEAFAADELHKLVLDRPWTFWERKLSMVQHIEE